MGEIQQSIGARFRERRIELGRTQEEVARMCGVAISTIQRLEVGSLNPTLDTLLGAAKAVDLPVQALLGPSPRIPPTPAEALEVLRLALHQPKLSPLESRAIEALRSLTPDQLLSAVTVIEATAQTPRGEASEPTHLDEELAKKKG